MAGLDRGYSGSGGEPPSEVRPMPFFPGQSGPVPPPLPPPGTPLPAPAPHAPPVPETPAPGPHAPVTPAVPLHGTRTPPEDASDDQEPDGPPGSSSATISRWDAPPSPAVPLSGDAPGGSPGGHVDGRITIEDQVIGKIAAMAALEVRGVVSLVGRSGPPGAVRGPAPDGRGASGVRIRLHEDGVTLDLGIAVEYGSVVMEVARVVRANVARVAGLMLGMRVMAVNVVVEDVRMPGEALRPS